MFHQLNYNHRKKSDNPPKDQGHKSDCPNFMPKNLAITLRLCQKLLINLHGGSSDKASNSGHQIR